MNDDKRVLIRRGARELTPTETDLINGGFRTLSLCSSSPSPDGTIKYPVTVPSGTPAPTAVKFYNSQAPTGKGSFNVTTPISVLIPGNAYAGTYTSTITITLVTGGL